MTTTSVQALGYTATMAQYLAVVQEVYKLHLRDVEGEDTTSAAENLSKATSIGTSVSPAREAYNTTEPTKNSLPPSMTPTPPLVSALCESDNDHILGSTEQLFKNLYDSPFLSPTLQGRYQDHLLGLTSWVTGESMTPGITRSTSMPPTEASTWLTDKAAAEFGSSILQLSDFVNADVPPQVTPNTRPDSSHPAAPIKDYGFKVVQNLKKAELKTLTQGPVITLYVGQIAITGISKRTAMLTSSVLEEYFTNNPGATQVHFKYGEVSPTSVQTLLISWPRTMSQTLIACEIGKQNTFQDNIELLRASYLLGMGSCTKTILRQHVKYLKNTLPSYEQIEIVERNATSGKDPLWTNMINQLCIKRYKRTLPDSKYFSIFLEEHAKLKAAMAFSSQHFADKARMRRR